jgi:hypothetical protein
MAVGYADTKVDFAGTGCVKYWITCVIQVSDSGLAFVIHFASGFTREV